ncbi:glycosyltransferase family 4 protein [Polaribacter sp.]|uniref:glycosyltransferase family 4 protein n=1 Tax=Polaribacter sp. TaxID=1920175 RepID=UPI0035C83F65
MHVCFLTNEYPKQGESHGGIGTFVKFLAENLASKGLVVSVLGINNSLLDENTVDNNVSIYRLGKSNRKFGKFYIYNRKIQKKLKEIHLQDPIDIVEGSELNFAFFPNRTSYKKLIRLHGGHHFFAIEQGLKPALWRGFQEKISFKKAGYFVAVSDFVGNQTKKYLNSNFSFKTIYNSINLESFYESNIEKEKPFKLVFIGTVCEKKGIDKLILALPLIKKQHPKVNLDIVGRDWFSKDGKSYIEYLKTIIEDDVRDNINFLGSQPYQSLPKIIESSQVCVFPSIVESFGLTIIEAMAMGKSVAASNIKPFKEIVANNDSVSFFNPNSIEDVSEKISILLSDKQMRNTNGKKNREHIYKMFETNKILDDNINFYKSILS